MLTLDKSLVTRSETSLRYFFTPGNLIKPGRISGIPGKLEFEQPSHTIHTLIDEEECYDLEHLRYPFHVQLREDLPTLMINHLNQIIGKKSVTPDLRYHWDMWKSKVSEQPLQSKEELSDLTRDTWRLIGLAFKIIHPDDACWLDFTETRDGRVKADIHMRLKSSGKIVLLEAVIDPKLADGYTSKLVKLASGELQSSFGSDLPDRFSGHEAILAKLSYEIMEDWEQGPRWAMIYGGNLYILYLVVPVLVGDTKRCSFVSSGVLSIDSTECPHLALMLYMMLSSRMSQEDLISTLGIQSPPGSIIASPKELDDISLEDGCNDSEPLDTSILLTAKRICLATSHGPSTEVFLNRLPDGSQVYRDTCEGPSELPKLFLRPVGSGSTSTVYRSNGVIIKVSGLRHEADMENEAQVYKHLMQTNASRFIPVFYGYFGNKRTRALILSDEGPVVKGLIDLPQDIRDAFFDALVEIHKEGVVHNKFDSDHVILNGSKLILFDFSRAHLGHVCPGVSECDELFHTQRRLHWD